MKRAGKSLRVVNPSNEAGLPRDAKRQMEDLLTEISNKESLIRQMRGELERIDETEVDNAEWELNRLKAAFADDLSKNDEEMFPLIEERNKQASILEGRKAFVQAVQDSSNERTKYSSILQSETEIVQSAISFPEPIKVDETELKKIIPQWKEIRDDLHSVYRSNRVAEKTIEGLEEVNNSLDRVLKKRVEAEQKSERKLAAVHKAGLQVVKQPKEEISDEWVTTKRTLELNTTLLESAMRSIDTLNEHIKRLTTDNTRLIEENRQLQEEVFDLEKYIPGEDEDEGQARTELTLQEIEIDVGKVKLDTIQKKTKIQKRSLLSLQKKKESVVSDTKQFEQQLQELKAKRDQCELVVRESQEELSKRMAQKLFMETERDELKKRIERQSEELNDLERRKEAAQKTLIQQQRAFDLNMQLESLKALDFDRFSSVVEGVLKVS